MFEPAPPNVAAGCERGTEEMEVGRMVWGGLPGAQDSWGMGGSTCLRTSQEGTKWGLREAWKTPFGLSLVLNVTFFG